MREDFDERPMLCNGHEVLIKNFTYEDRIAKHLDFGPELRLLKKFALLPTMTMDGKVWMKVYWSLEARSWDDSAERSLWKTKLLFGNQNSLIPQIGEWMDHHYVGCDE